MIRALVLFLILISSCSFSKYPSKWRSKGIVPEEKQVHVYLGESRKNLKILYTGCGGVTIDDGTEVISTDPFFSNQPFMNIQLGKIWVRPQYVEVGLKQFEDAAIENKKIKHVLIAHSHYDHLMDLPYLIQNKIFDDSVRFYGSTTSENVLKDFLEEKSFVNIESKAFYAKNDFAQTGKWISLSKRIRVLAIEAEHAPHFLNIEMMHGEVGKEGVPNFQKSTDKTKATDWKRGKVFSFLIDYMNGDNVELRIFIQSSSCDPPYGIPPLAELEKKKIDLAFIGVASTQNVKNYPETLLKTIDPNKIVLIHWEDFFRPYGSSVKTVRFTNFNLFFKRLRKVYNVESAQDLKGKVIMPEPGTLMKIEY